MWVNLMQLASPAFKKIVLLTLLLCVTFLLSACQDKEWYTQSEIVGGQQITAQFPTKPSVLERTYQLLTDEAAEPLSMVQWYAADGENSFNLSYILVSGHLDTDVVANELLRSMTLKRDPRLQEAPADFIAEYETDLPALGERFDVSVGLDSKHLTATAMVLREGNLVVQLYTAGTDSSKNFNQQRQHFFEQFKIGATIP
ncbi:MAG TPA: hypothetical protein VFD12_01165 [Oligella sp.]|nr:hypothetical protein [Oligella sp.]